MKKKISILLLFFTWMLIPNIHAQYSTPNSGFYQPAVGSDMPTQQSSFQSSSYYNNTYTVPFAAENVEIGSNDPYASSAPSGRRNAPPEVTGPFIDPPGGLPGSGNDNNQPLGDGMWFLLFCAVGVVLRITFKRTAKA